MLSMDELIDKMIEGAQLELADVQHVRSVADKETRCALRCRNTELYSEWLSVRDAANAYLINAMNLVRAERI